MIAVVESLQDKIKGSLHHMSQRAFYIVVKFLRDPESSPGSDRGHLSVFVFLSVLG